MKKFVVIMFALSIGICAAPIPHQTAAASTAANVQAVKKTDAQQQVCKFPDEVTLKFSIAQVKAIGAWAANQDYSHALWQSIMPTITPQFAEIQRAACKTKK